MRSKVPPLKRERIDLPPDPPARRECWAFFTHANRPLPARLHRDENRIWRGERALHGRRARGVFRPLHGPTLSRKRSSCGRSRSQENSRSNFRMSPSRCRRGLRECQQYCPPRAYWVATAARLAQRKGRQWWRRRIRVRSDRYDSAQARNHTDVNRVRFRDFGQRFASSAAPLRLLALEVGKLRLAAKLDAVRHGALAGLNAGRMPDLVYHLLGSLRVSSCSNEFHGTPRETIPAGKMTKSPGRN